jgi:hypothetical protein
MPSADRNTRTRGFFGGDSNGGYIQGNDVSIDPYHNGNPNDDQYEDQGDGEYQDPYVGYLDDFDPYAPELQSTQVYEYQQDNYVVDSVVSVNGNDYEDPEEFEQPDVDDGGPYLVSEPEQMGPYSSDQPNSGQFDNVTGDSYSWDQSASQIDNGYDNGNDDSGNPDLTYQPDFQSNQPEPDFDQTYSTQVNDAQDSYSSEQPDLAYYDGFPNDDGQDQQYPDSAQYYYQDQDQDQNEDNHFEGGNEHVSHHHENNPPGHSQHSNTENGSALISKLEDLRHSFDKIGIEQPSDSSVSD